MAFLLGTDDFSVLQLGNKEQIRRTRLLGLWMYMCVYTSVTIAARIWAGF